MSVNKKNIQIGIGISSILMIFVVLCMTILSVLAYRDATQKMNVTLRQQEYQQRYMKADANMQYILATLEKQSYDDVSQIEEDIPIHQISEQFEIDVNVQDDTCVLVTPVFHEQVLRVTFTIKEQKPYITSYQITM